MSCIRPLAAALAATALALAGCDREAPADKTPASPPAAGQTPVATETVMDLISRDPDHTTLVSALHVAGMADTLDSAGPFTLFAPTNASLEKIPAERREFLTSEAGLPELRRILSYHVVPGRLDAASLVQRTQAGGGTLALTTLQGGVLTARVGANGSVELTDAAGGTLRVVEADAVGSNGVVHAVDALAAPG